MELVAKVQAREWLRSEDGTDIPDLNVLKPGRRPATDSGLALGIVVVLVLLIIAIAGWWLAIAARRRIRRLEQRLSALQQGQAVTADAVPLSASPAAKIE
jgi:hypothetical protein